MWIQTVHGMFVQRNLSDAGDKAFNLLAACSVQKYFEARGNIVRSEGPCMGLC